MSAESTFIGASPAGFTVPDVPLPRPSHPLDRGARDRAACIVLAAQRGWTPEEFELGVCDEQVCEVFADDLERQEAFDWVGMVAAVLESGR